jgi:hypothetical protein
MITFAEWLALREPADAAARSTELAGRVARYLTGPTPAVIHDLGSGTGSMGRWLAPRLPGPQHWVLHDRDAALLATAAADLPARAADGSRVTVRTRVGDITRLSPADLSGATLITASALLDMFTADELDRFVAACAGTPCLITLSVVGGATLEPAEPLDAEIAAAFDDHQRRATASGTLLGPDAADAAVAAFARHGVGTQVRSTPWRLGPDRPELLDVWFRGWVDAAVEQRPALAAQVTAYAARRAAQAGEGRLRSVIRHTDLLTACD